MRARLRVAALVVALGAATPEFAIADAYDGDWHISLSPYLWLASSDTSLQFRTPGGEILRTSLKVGPLEVIRHLHIGVAGFADVRKGEWSAFSDLIYVSVGDSGARVRDITFPDGSTQIPISLHTSVGVQELVWTGGLGYAVLHDGLSSADVFVGARAAGANASINWQFAGPLNQFPLTGDTSRYKSVWDGVVGVRGRIGFSDTPWFVPYYADIGTGGSHLTAQALTGIGYGFSWGDLLLTYRGLYYQPGHSGVIDHLTMYGFLLGATFRI